MIALEETTNWSPYNTPNHTYFTNDSKDKMFAYVKAGTNEVFEFSVPLPINTRGRKFKTITNTWGFFAKDELSLTSKSWKIPGSKGNEYTLSEEAGVLTCSCSGFKFRSKCKHTADVAKAL